MPERFTNAIVQPIDRNFIDPYAAVRGDPDPQRGGLEALGRTVLDARLVGNLTTAVDIRSSGPATVIFLPSNYHNLIVARDNPCALFMA